MSRIVLWNSVAARRRSISDTFYDNGLGRLKAYLEERDHTVLVVDWARSGVFRSLTPAILSMTLRVLYALLLGSASRAFRRLIGATCIPLQDLLGALQQMRLNARIRRLAREVAADGARVVGVKVWYGQAFTNAKYLVEELGRVAPEVITIAGGYHATLYEERVLDTTRFDLAVVCEGESALEEILRTTGHYEHTWNKTQALMAIRARAERGEIPNLLYRGASGVERAARVPLPAKVATCFPRYDRDPGKVSVHVVVESLGCDWGKCNFCVHSHMQPGYRRREPAEVVAEMREMARAGIGVFRFAGSDTPPSFGAKIAQEIRESGLTTIFAMGSRAARGAVARYASLVESYRTLIEGGLKSLFMGCETANDLVNEKAMNKGVTREDIAVTVRALREAERLSGLKVYLVLALIHPPPLMGLATLDQVREDNLDLLDETRPDSVMITPPGPFLHTRWYEEKDLFGFSFDEDAIRQAMEYEYVLYKPPHLWPRLGISLEGRPFARLLSECGEMRSAVEEKLGIPTDVSDEHFLMFYSAGLRSPEQIREAKRKTVLDILSCDYRASQRICRRVNTFSRKIGSAP